MDNVCHTLVGAALGEAGLKKRTRYGNAALMIAANLPDIDVLVFATGTPSVAFRRGWTHGILAQAVLPIALTAVLLAVARFRGKVGPGTAGSPGVRAMPLLLLSYAGLYSHVFLDYLNNYGIRLLTPFDWRWFYGDSVFIIDPWLWLMLGAGVWLARRRRVPVPARGALVFAACYIALMMASAWAARDAVVKAWSSARGAEPRALMVGPMPITPFERNVIVDAGGHYEVGTFSWLTSGVTFGREIVAKNSDAPEVEAARRDPNVRAFLVWSRFPFWEIQPTPGGARVTVRDMRFGDRFEASSIVGTPPSRPGARDTGS